MPGKTEYRITFGTRSKPPVVRENSVEVCDMIPAFLDQNMSWFSSSDQNMLFFLPYLRSNESQNVTFSPSCSDQNIRNFIFPVSELNRCSREAVDDKCICGYNPPEALSPDMGFKLFTIKISTLLQLQLCPAYSSVYAKKPELLNYISYNLNSQIKYWNQTQIKSRK